MEIRQEVFERYSQLTQALLRIAAMQPIATTDALFVVNNRITALLNQSMNHAIA